MPYPAVLTFLRANNAEVISDALVNKFANNIIGAGYIDIEKQFKPELIKRYENPSSFKSVSLATKAN
jgi:hypothetical protein